MEDRANAFRALDWTMERGQRTAQACRERGNAFWSRGEYEEALYWYTQSLELDHGQYAVLTNRSAVYAKLSPPDWQRSLADAVESARLNPNWVKAYYRQGLALLALGSPEKAKVAIERGIILDGDNEQLNSIFQKAVEAANAAPRCADDARLKGNECYRQGDYEEAVKWYTKSIGLTEDCSGKFRQVAQILVNRAEAKRQIGSEHARAVVDDCTNALQLLDKDVQQRATSQSASVDIMPATDSIRLKAILRRAFAWEDLEQYENALQDFMEAHAMDRTAKQAHDGRMRVEKVLRTLERIKC